MAERQVCLHLPYSKDAHMILLHRWLVFFITLSLSTSTFAQSNFNRSNISHSSEAFTVEDGFENSTGMGNQYRGFLSLQYDYVKNPYIVINSDDKLRLAEVVRDFTRLRLAGGYYVSKSLYIGASLPMDSVKAKRVDTSLEFQNDNIADDAIPYPISDSGFILGDAEVFAKFRIPGWSKTWSWAAMLGATVPTGDEEFFNTDTGLGYFARLGFTHYFGLNLKWRAYGHFGYKYSPDSKFKLAQSVTEIDTTSRFDSGFGLSYAWSNRWRSFAEIRGFWSFPIEDGQNPVEATLGLDYKLKKTTTVYAGAGLETMLGDLYSHDLRYLFGVKHMFGRRNNLVVSEEQFIQDHNPGLKYGSDISGKTEKQKQLYSFYFSTDSAELNNNVLTELRKVSSAFLKHRDYIGKVVIQGHADSRGEDDYNLNLSKRRADNIKEFLVNHGVDESVLVVDPVGEKNIFKHDETGILERQKNRRVDAYIEGLR